MKRRLFLLVKGVGIDLIRIKRIARVYRRRPERFLKKIFTPQEIELIMKKGNPLPSIAARFAAKEAVAKALGCGIGVVRWCELEIIPGKRGKPRVILNGSAARWAEDSGIQGVEVSMSHDGPYAIAKAVAYGK